MSIRVPFILPPSSFTRCVLGSTGLAKMGSRSLRRLSPWALPTSPERPDPTASFWPKRRPSGASAQGMGTAARRLKAITQIADCGLIA